MTYFHTMRNTLPSSKHSNLPARFFSAVLLLGFGISQRSSYITKIESGAWITENVLRRAICEHWSPRERWSSV